MTKKNTPVKTAIGLPWDALHASEIRYRRLFESAKDGILILDAETGQINDVNPFLVGLLGYSREQFVNKTIWDIGFFKDIIANRSNFVTLKEKKYIRYENLPLETADGRKIDVEFVSNVYLEDHHNVIQCNIRDNTERKRNEDSIHYQANLLENVSDAIIATDMHYNILFWNKAAEEQYGWPASEVIGHSLEMFITNDYLGSSLDKVLEKISCDGCWKGEVTQNRRDGVRIPVLSTLSIVKNKAGQPSGFIAVNRDITEKQKLLESIQRADKLDSIGVLAGGIAHDFNNLLGGFFGYVDLARETCGAESETAAYLDKALLTLTRARDLTRQLLTFAKGGVPVRTTGHLSSILKECTQFALSGSSVAPSFHIAGDLLPCDFDENQMCQVVDNIVINAVQAMPLGGMINITADNIEIKHDDIPSLKQGTYVHVAIADTGAGIPQSILPRIFDPFFTTKQKGNGLGLAMAYSIIRKHNGEITVESEPGIGTTLHFYLPVSEKKVATQAVMKAGSHKGSGRILVMDDEQAIRETAGDMLGLMGYDVEYALNGNEAIEMVLKAAELKKPFLAAIIDLTIPGGMGGKETIEKMRETEKNLVVFVSSGYSEDPILADPTEYGFTDRIGKPFIRVELANLFSRHFGAG